MKIRALFLSVVALGAVAFASVTVPSCSILKPVVNNVTDPSTPAGAIVADCAKPELAGQIANVLAGINMIALDPSKATQVKNDEIDALKKAGQEALICALRAGVTDLTVLISGAVQAHASIDPRLVQARNLFAGNVFSHGYSYKDGWSASTFVGAGGAGGHGGAAGMGGAGGGAGVDAGAGGAGGSAQ